jgi:hypothetical protein
MPSAIREYIPLPRCHPEAAQAFATRRPANEGPLHSARTMLLFTHPNRRPLPQCHPERSEGPMHSARARCTLPSSASEQQRRVQNRTVRSCRNSRGTGKGDCRQPRDSDISLHADFTPGTYSFGDHDRAEHPFFLRQFRLGVLPVADALGSSSRRQRYVRSAI